MKSGEQDGVCGKRGDSAGGEIVQDRSGDSHNEICYYAL